MTEPGLSAFFLAIATGCACELMLRLPVMSHLQALYSSASRAAATLRLRHASDHWKERALLAYARRLLVHSIIAPALVLVACLPVFMAAVAITGSLTGGVRILSGFGMIGFLTLVAITYVFVRSKLFHARVQRD